MITVKHLNTILEDSLISIGGSGFIVCGDEEETLHQLEVATGYLGGVWYPLKDSSLYREEFSRLHFDIKEGRLKIHHDYDDYDCDTCGSNFATGYILEIDGVEYSDIAASAGCFDSPSYHSLDVILYLLDIYNISYKLEGGHSPYHIIKNLYY